MRRNFAKSMGIFFSTPKPRITQREWKMIRGNLYGRHNFTTKELDKVEAIFQGDMAEERKIDVGIDANEVARGIQYMRSHMKVHLISPAKMLALESEMIKYIGLSK